MLRHRGSSRWALGALSFSLTLTETFCRIPTAVRSVPQAAYIKKEREYRAKVEFLEHQLAEVRVPWEHLCSVVCAVPSAAL
jgi:hypothetical protein